MAATRPHAAATVASVAADLLTDLSGRPCSAVREGVDGLVSQLGTRDETCPPDDFERVLGVLRALYAASLSAEGIPLARALLRLAEARGDSVWQRRALTAFGLVLADAGDVVGGLERHVESLRIAHAHSDMAEASRSWNNIGLALGVAGAHELAARAYERSLARAAAVAGPLHQRFAANANLASSLYHLGNFSEGLAYAERALELLLPQYAEQDPHSTILLHRNVIRLLAALGRAAEAAPHVRAISLLAGRSASPRSRIAAATALAAHDLALGRTDVALTRVERSLEQARRVPAALHETLLFAVHAEECAGRSERAAERLRELSELAYRSRLERTRALVELAPITEAGLTGIDRRLSQARERIEASLSPRRAPNSWPLMQRLAAGAVLPMDCTGEHGARVGTLTRALARASGVVPLEALEFGAAAELHDLGLSSVPPHVPAKRGSLGEVERAVVRRHATAGADVLRGEEHPRYLLAHDIARYHHERWDGGGYPDGVSGAAIPLPARMCAIAEAFDAMVSGLCGGARRTIPVALERLREEAGGQFDPDLVEHFGTAIRVHAQEYGIGVSAHAGTATLRDLLASLETDRGFA